MGMGVLSLLLGLQFLLLTNSFSSFLIEPNYCKTLNLKVGEVMMNAGAIFSPPIGTYLREREVGDNKDDEKPPEDDPPSELPEVPESTLSVVSLKSPSSSSSARHQFGINLVISPVELTYINSYQFVFSVETTKKNDGALKFKWVDVKQRDVGCGGKRVALKSKKDEEKEFDVILEVTGEIVEGVVIRCGWAGGHETVKIPGEIDLLRSVLELDGDRVLDGEKREGEKEAEKKGEKEEDTTNDDDDATTFDDTIKFSLQRFYLVIFLILAIACWGFLAKLRRSNNNYHKNR
ncbi:hypothetical protein ScalyP_jg8298 [Parmales sp. scaly parma]|nr:hypothetical protein ScalyP_jg8298 [Parmales sp. scaly parma]